MATTAALYATASAQAAGTWDGTWTNPGNAAGAPNAAMAAWTNTTRRGTNALEMSGYGAQTAVGDATAVIDSVAVAVTHNETSTSILSATVALYNGTTLVGAAQTLTMSATTATHTLTFTGLAYAALADLRVRVTYLRTNVTTSVTGNIDAAGVTVTYHLPVVSAKTATAAAAAVASGVQVVTAGLAALDTLVDDFSTVRADLWGTTNAALVTQSPDGGGTMSIALGDPATASYDELWSIGAYRLRGSSAYTELMQAAGVAGAASYETLFRLDCGNGQLVEWLTYGDGTGLIARHQVGGVATEDLSTTRDPAAMRYLRTGESGGVITYATSPDASTWTTAATVDLSAVFAAGWQDSVTVHLVAGHWQAETVASPPAIFGGVNAPAPAAVYAKTGGGAAGGAAGGAKTVGTGGGGAPVALVQQKTAAVSVAATAHPVTFDTPTTAGNFLLVVVATAGGATANVTGGSGGGNTWTELHDLGVSGATNTHLAIYYAVNAAPTTTVTLTTTTALTSQLIAIELSGVPTATPIDVSSIVAEATAATSHSSPSLTPSAAGYFVAAFINHSGASDPVLSGTTYTALGTPATVGTIHGRGAYRIPSSAVAESVTWTGTASVRATTATVVIKSVGGGSPPTVTVDQWWISPTRVAVRTQGSTAPVRVAFSASSGMGSPVYTASAVTPDAQGISMHTLPALTGDTVYYYQAEVSGTLTGTVQSFRTLPTGQASFKLGFGSCRSHTLNVPSPDAPAYADALTRGADLFLHTGDIHYRNINTATASSYYIGYDELHTRANLAALFSQIPNAYVWSDHDFCGDNSDTTFTGRDAARTAYKERIPAPTMPGAGIYHTFLVGRVRIVMLDTRSYRSPSANTDDASKTMLGAEQKTWLQGLLATPDTPLTFIVSDVPWTATGTGSDHWGRYDTERQVVAGWITASTTKVVFLCGDSHCLAFDDGTNSAAGVHTWQAAPINENGGTTGGPYSGGSLQGSGQYGFVDVTDTGSTITATYSGIKSDFTVWSTDTVIVGAQTYLKAGAAAAAPTAAGSAVRTAAAVHAKTGTGAAAATGAGVSARTAAQVRVKAGTAAAAGAASGVETVAGAQVYAKAGTGVAGGAGSGAKTVTGAQVRAKAGAGAAAAAASGVQARSSAQVWTKTGASAAGAVAGGAKLRSPAPATVLNIGPGAGQNHFKVQVAPVGSPNQVEHSQAEIVAGYREDPYFVPTADGARTQFYARLDGPLSSGAAGGSRAELREVNPDGSETSYDALTGTHVFTLTTRATHLPPVNPAAVLAQLHDGVFGDRISIRTQLISGITKLVCRVNGTSTGLPRLSENYTVDTEFTVRIQIVGGLVTVFYNDLTTPLISNAGPLTAGAANPAWNWKAGVYNQSTTDVATEYAAAEITSVNYSHAAAGQVVKAGAGAARGAATGTKTVTAGAQVIVKAGAGTAGAGASGPKVVTGAQVRAKTGAGAASVAAAGTKTVAAAQLWVKTGSAAAGGAGGGTRAVTSSGTASVVAVDYVAVAVTYAPPKYATLIKTGGAAAGTAAAGARVVVGATQTTAQTATVTVGALDATVQITPAVEVAPILVAAGDAATTLLSTTTVSAESAALPVDGLAPAAALAVPAGSGSVTVDGQPATPATAALTQVGAGAAALDVPAADGAATVAAPAGAGPVTVDGQSAQPSAGGGVVAGAALPDVAALDAAATIVLSAGSSSVAVDGQPAAAAVTVPAEVGAATVDAYPALLSVSESGAAQTGAVSVSAGDAAVTVVVGADTGVVGVDGQPGAVAVAAAAQPGDVLLEGEPVTPATASVTQAPAGAAAVSVDAQPAGVTEAAAAGAAVLDVAGAEAIPVASGTTNPTPIPATLSVAGIDGSGQVVAGADPSVITVGGLDGAAAVTPNAETAPVYTPAGDAGGSVYATPTGAAVAVAGGDVSASVPAAADVSPVGLTAVEPSGGAAASAQPSTVDVSGQDAAPNPGARPGVADVSATAQDVSATATTQPQTADVTVAAPVPQVYVTGTNQVLARTGDVTVDAYSTDLAVSEAALVERADASVDAATGAGGVAAAAASASLGVDATPPGGAVTPAPPLPAVVSVDAQAASVLAEAVARPIPETAGVTVDAHPPSTAATTEAFPAVFDAAGRDALVLLSREALAFPAAVTVAAAEAAGSVAPGVWAAWLDLAANEATVVVPAARGTIEELMRVGPTMAPAVPAAGTIEEFTLRPVPVMVPALVGAGASAEGADPPAPSFEPMSRG